MRTLIIDNYDSYTFNLFQIVAKVNQNIPEVIFNNQCSWLELKSRLHKYDNVILSPGPGVPAKEEDFGLCKNIITDSGLPVFGVCLGHQGIAHCFGGKVVKARQVAHGIQSNITFKDGHPLFAGVDQNFQAVRYHSWIVDKVPDCIEEIAWTDEGGARLNMGLCHRTKPLWGVQFHPESICSSFGEKIISNFCSLTRQYWLSRGQPRSFIPTPFPPAQKLQEMEKRYTTDHYKMQFPYIDQARLFSALSQQIKGNSDAISFWLDSALQPEKQRSRFSFFGFCDKQSLVTYDVATKVVKVGTREIVLEHGRTFFDFLRMFMQEHGVAHDDRMPFDLQCGLVGYLSYEMGVECGMGCTLSERVEGFGCGTPDAAFAFAEKVVVLDLLEKEVYFVIARERKAQAGNTNWIAEMKDFFTHFTEDHVDEASEIKEKGGGSELLNSDGGGTIEFFMQHDHQSYIEKIEECRNQIRDGESYELCLTNKFSSHARPPDALQYYLTLRETNPAPHGAFFDFGAFQVVSCSPEIFLSVDSNKQVVSKPIKGTAPRGKTPEEDARLKQALACGEKEFSENLMIVDLIRNDFGKNCVVSSVHVPILMAVESYATVHQLVTTVKGSLAHQYSSVDIMQSMFPPGSMTGAPKIRSVDILHQLEHARRGIYSGCIGYFSLSGCCAFSVVIRTAVLNDGGMHIGVGGAITYASTAEEEFEEILLKSRALLRPLKDTKIWGTPKFPYHVTPSTDYQLLETVLYDRLSGFSDLNLHIDRMKRSAKYLQFPNFDRHKLQTDVDSAAQSFESGKSLRVRIIHYRNGENQIQSFALTPLRSSYTIEIAKVPVRSADTMLQHKTTSRDVYQNALNHKSEFADDVVLFNEKGEITESCIANIAIMKNGKLITPPVNSGLLPGIMRDKLLAEGRIEEGVIMVQHLKKADRIFLFNSVRGLFKVQLRH